jgi:spore cortex formation protein SpoVR/YcgB (stage V sporulation)
MSESTSLLRGPLGCETDYLPQETSAIAKPGIDVLEVPTEIDSALLRHTPSGAQRDQRNREAALTKRVGELVGIIDEITMRVMELDSRVRTLEAINGVPQRVPKKSKKP